VSWGEREVNLAECGKNLRLQRTLGTVSTFMPLDVGKQALDPLDVQSVSQYASQQDNRLISNAAMRVANIPKPFASLLLRKLGIFTTIIAYGIGLGICN
jgi:hypothetical protein